jgi:zinc transporter, ZIP family
MLREAHEAAEDTRLSAGFFIGGSALFTLVAAYFEA